MINSSLFLLSTALIATMVQANPKSSEVNVGLHELHSLRNIANGNSEEWNTLQITRLVIPGSHTDQLTYALEMIHLRLKSFIYEIHFAYEAFNSQANEIGIYLENLGFLIVAGDFESGELADRFTFARSMFQTMKEATVLLKYYEMNGTGPFLMSRVIQLNIALLAFYDSTGLPNFLAPGFVDSLQSYSRMLESWSSLLEQVENFPKASSLVFQAEKRKAIDTIDVLLTFTVEDWIYLDESYIKDLMKYFT